MLYLHEIIDIRGDGQQAYLDAVIERAKHSEAQAISRLLGTWRVIGSTGGWPRVVNLWEMDGWEHWASTLERQFIPAKKDAALGPWWSQVAQWRRGGFDRIAEPAAFSPTVQQLKEQGLRSWVCVHTLTRVQPGRAAEYLEAINTEMMPLLVARGLTLIGAYSIPMRSDEVLTLWAARDFRSLCELYAQRTSDRELAERRGRLQRRRLDCETMWLVPAADCFFSPAAETA